MKRLSRSGRLAVSVVGLFLACSAALALPCAALAQGSETSETRRRSPALAFAFSVVIPGGGQAYNGEWGKGAFVFGTAVTGVGLFGYDGAACLWDDDGENCTRAAVGLAVVGLVVLYSWVDAPLTARSMNRRIRLGEKVTAEFGPGLWADSPAVRGRAGDLDLVRLRF